MFVKKFALPIFPDEPAAAQICAADFSPCWHGCRYPLSGPIVFFVKP
jgi:hypothetical protein